MRLSISLRRLLGVVAACVIGGAALSACTSGSGTDYTFTSATQLGHLVAVKDRKQAQDVGGRDLIGSGRTTLRRFAGHVLVVDFFASWCGPCGIETPLLDTVYRSERAHGIDVFGVDTKDQDSAGRTFVRQKDISFPVISDEPGKVLLQLGNLPSAGLPVTVLIDKKQRVAAVYLARFTAKDLDPVLARLAAER